MGSYQEVTAIYCGLTGSMVGCFQSRDMLSLQVEWSNQAGPSQFFMLGAVVQYNLTQFLVTEHIPALEE